mmetsp:Transcript_17351/g.55810  ORF Transcript_17351/g.55810 Transcript_17351/m.55810 type:complete len:290 (-) Transcript_17351:473-1342(-)
MLVTLIGRGGEGELRVTRRRPRERHSAARRAGGVLGVGEAREEPPRGKRRHPAQEGAHERHQESGRARGREGQRRVAHGGGDGDGQVGARPRRRGEDERASEGRAAESCRADVAIARHVRVARLDKVAKPDVDGERAAARGALLGARRSRGDGGAHARTRTAEARGVERAEDGENAALHLEEDEREDRGVVVAEERGHLEARAARRAEEGREHGTGPAARPQLRREGEEGEERAGRCGERGREQQRGHAPCARRAANRVEGRCGGGQAQVQRVRQRAAASEAGEAGRQQ